jgi:hypothetical protein
MAQMNADSSASIYGRPVHRLSASNCQNGRLHRPFRFHMVLKNQADTAKEPLSKPQGQTVHKSFSKAWPVENGLMTFAKAFPPHRDHPRYLLASAMKMPALLPAMQHFLPSCWPRGGSGDCVRIFFLSTSTAGKCPRYLNAYAAQTRRPRLAVWERGAGVDGGPPSA